MALGARRDRATGAVSLTSELRAQVSHKSMSSSKRVLDPRSGAGRIDHGDGRMKIMREVEEILMGLTNLNNRNG